MLIPHIEETIELYLEFLKKYQSTQIEKLQFKISDHSKHINYNQDYQGTFYIYEEKSHVCFEAKFKIPRGLNETQHLYLNFDMEGEAILFINDIAVYGIDYQHKEFLFNDLQSCDQEVHITLKLSTGRKIPSAENSFRPFSKDKVILSHRYLKDNYPIIFNGASIYTQNKVINELFYDAKVLFDIAQTLGSHSLLKHSLLYELYQILSCIPLEHVEDKFTQDKLIAQARLCSDRIQNLYQRKNLGVTPHVFLIGHAHIDYAWLWEKQDAIFKMEKTYLTLQKLIQSYPELKFIQTQAMTLDILSKNNSLLMDKIKQNYEQKKWEMNASSYVEMDCNIPSGESLIRQMLYGWITSKSHFPDYTEITLWLPDAFGFTSVLPQIMYGFGLKYLVTGKLIWNDTSLFPYDKFIWKGLDGSSVKVYILTGKLLGYNGQASVSCIQEAWENVQHKEIQSEILFPVGMGDGGGGPTIQDIEYARRVQNVEGFPITTWQSSNDSLNLIFANETELPSYNDELYFERHRGTYTTQASIKCWNRRLEFLLREVELRISLNHLVGATKKKYTDWIKRSWKILLENQFHDIICGVCISDVYPQVIEQYERLEHDLLRVLIEESLRYFYSVQGEYVYPNPILICFHSYNWHYEDLIIVKSEFLPAEYSGGQSTVDLKQNEITYVPICINPFSYTVIQNNNYHKEDIELVFQFHNNVLNTPYYNVKFDMNGNMISLQDKANGYEYISQNQCFNSFHIYEDVPIKHDAWDIQQYYKNKELKLVISSPVQVISVGEHFIQLRRDLSFGYHSSGKQDIFFYAKSNRIDFKNKVIWLESHKLLKVGFFFNLDVEEMEFDIQFGYIKRSTKRNNDADRAKYEVLHHKWMRARNDQIGVCVINDSKYGCSYGPSHYMLTLLRSAKAPDEQADMEQHHIVYAFLPETSTERIYQEAYKINNPPRIVVKDKASASMSNLQRIKIPTDLIQLDHSQVIIETIKLCEYDDKAIIIRCFHPYNQYSVTTLTVNSPFVKIEETNLKEESIQAKDIIKTNQIRLEFHPFEIKTIKIQYA